MPVPATITGLVLAEGLMAAVLSDTLSLTAPRSTAELRFCSTRYQVCLNFQLELELTQVKVQVCPRRKQPKLLPNQPKIILVAHAYASHRLCRLLTLTLTSSSKDSSTLD
jgi:hypothetical protein